MMMLQHDPLDWSRTGKYEVDEKTGQISGNDFFLPRQQMSKIIIRKKT